MKTILAGLLLVAVPSLAVAQSVPPGFFASGQTGLEYVDADGGSAGLYLGYFDATFGLDGAKAGSSVPLGIQIDVFALRELEDGTLDRSAIHPWIFYDTSFGRLSLGRPRPLADDFLAQARFSGSYTFDKFLYSAILASPLSAARSAEEADILSARFDGTVGALRYGLSYSEVEDSDVTVSSAALGYDTGNIEFGLVYETFQNAGSDVDFVGASVVGNYGNTRLTARYTSGSALEPDSTAINLSVDYAITDQVSVGGAYTNFDDGVDTFDLTHVYAACEIFAGLDGELGYTTSDSDDIYVGAVRYGFDF